MDLNPLNSIIFQPERYPAGPWYMQATFGALDVNITTKDEVQIHGWWFPVDNCTRATLFLHGNAGNVSHRIDHASALNRAGSSVLVIDYRGYGRSAGRPSMRGVRLDADAGYAWLTRAGFRTDRLIIHGESLGTALATEVSSRNKCAALILESPFSSLSAMADLVVPFAGRAFVHGFKTASLIKKIRVPKLIIHGERDEIVPFSQGREVFDAAPEPKEFWAVPRAGHNDLLDRAFEDYVLRLREFYQNMVPDPS